MMHGGESKLLQAAAEGDLERVRTLVEREGTNINCQGNLNRTPLHQAALWGKVEVALYLCEKGANLNSTASSLETPLHLATLNGHKAVVELLLDEGADLTLKNSSGKTALDLARKRDMKQCLEEAAQGRLPKQCESEKPRAFAPHPETLQQLQDVGYSKGAVLEQMHKLFERQLDYCNVAVVMKELVEAEKKLAAAAAPNAVPENKDAGEDNSCKICFERAIDAVLLNCGHFVVCMECSDGLQACPMCRSPIAKVVKIFKS